MTTNPLNPSSSKSPEEIKKKNIWFRIHSAIYRAKMHYPPPVADVLAIELNAWAEFGHLIGGSRVMIPLIDHLLSLPDRKVAEGEINV